jgi:alpha-N-arabinofuranosidase
MDMHRVAGCTSLHCSVVCDKYDVPGYAIDDMNQYGGFEGVETVQAAAAFSPETGDLTVFVLNADLQEDQLLTLNLKGFDRLSLLEHTELYSDDPDACNTFEKPDAIRPKKNMDTVLDSGVLTARLHRASWNVFRFTV